MAEMWGGRLAAKMGCDEDGCEGAELGWLVGLLDGTMARSTVDNLENSLVSLPVALTESELVVRLENGGVEKMDDESDVLRDVSTKVDDWDFLMAVVTWAVIVELLEAEQKVMIRAANLAAWKVCEAAVSMAGWMGFWMAVLMDAEMVVDLAASLEASLWGNEQVAATTVVWSVSYLVVHWVFEMAGGKVFAQVDEMVVRMDWRTVGSLVPQSVLKSETSMAEWKMAEKLGCGKAGEMVELRDAIEAVKLGDELVSKMGAQSVALLDVAMAVMKDAGVTDVSTVDETDFLTLDDGKVFQSVDWSEDGTVAVKDIERWLTTWLVRRSSRWPHKGLLCRLATVGVVLTFSMGDEMALWWAERKDTGLAELLDKRLGATKAAVWKLAKNRVDELVVCSVELKVESSGIDKVAWLVVEKESKSVEPKESSLVGWMADSMGETLVVWKVVKLDCEMAGMKVAVSDNEWEYVWADLWASCEVALLVVKWDFEVAVKLEPEMDSLLVAELWGVISVRGLAEQSETSEVASLVALMDLEHFEVVWWVELKRWVAAMERVVAEDLAGGLEVVSELVQWESKSVAAKAAWWESGLAGVEMTAAVKELRKAQQWAVLTGKNLAAYSAALLVAEMASSRKMVVKMEICLELCSAVWKEANKAVWMVYGWVEMWTASTASRWAASRAALLDVRMVVMMASWSVAGMLVVAMAGKSEKRWWEILRAVRLEYELGDVSAYPKEIELVEISVAAKEFSMAERMAGAKMDAKSVWKKVVGMELLMVAWMVSSSVGELVVWKMELSLKATLPAALKVVAKVAVKEIQQLVARMDCFQVVRTGFELVVSQVAVLVIPTEILMVVMKVSQWVDELVVWKDVCMVDESAWKSVVKKDE
eukprot:gene17821-18048_t